MGLFDRKNSPQKVEISISTATLVRIIATVIAILLLIALLNKLADALVIIFVAFFLALALNAPVHWLANKMPGKKRGSRALGTSIAFLIVVLVISSFIALLAPSAVRETTNFAKSVPQLVETLRDENSSIGHFVQEYDLQDDIDEFTSSIADSAKNSTAFSS